MTFSISTRTLACINSFEQAREFWNKTTPWRDQCKSWRPLDNRRAYHKRLVKISEEGLEGYECVLYRTALVTYYADGTIALQTHESVSSGMFARHVCPPQCSMLNHAGRTYWCVTTDGGREYYTQNRIPLNLARTESGNWLLLNEPEPREEWVSNLALVRKVNRQLQAYETYYAVTSRLYGMPRTGLMPSRTDIPGFLDQRPETFTHAFADGVTPDSLRRIAHEVTGARYKQLAPFDRLPRNTA